MSAAVDLSVASPIETLRLRLRCPTEADAAEISNLITPAVSRWVATWPCPYTKEMAINRISSALNAASRGLALSYAVVDKQQNSLMGWVSVVRGNVSDRKATLGYWLGEAFQGKGFMREAAQEVVSAAFREMDLDTIEAASQPENLSSLAVLRRCGMRYVGERLIYASARGREELCVAYEVGLVSARK